MGALEQTARRDPRRHIGKLSTCIRKYDDVLKVGFRFQVSGMEIAIAET